MQRKINDMVICLQMGKNLMTKTPPGDFQVTILETPLRLRSQFAWTEFAQCLCNLFIVWRLLKQSFYMSRVRRKEDPKTYSRIPRKSNLNSKILKPRQIGGVEKLSSSYRALMNLHSLLDLLNRLEGFNTWSWNAVSWSI